MLVSVSIPKLSLMLKLCSLLFRYQNCCPSAKLPIQSRLIYGMDSSVCVWCRKMEGCRLRRISWNFIYITWDYSEISSFWIRLISLIYFSDRASLLVQWIEIQQVWRFCPVREYEFPWEVEFQGSWISTSVQLLKVQELCLYTRTLTGKKIPKGVAGLEKLDN